MGSGFDASSFQSGLEKAKEAKLRAAAHAMDEFGEHVIGDAQQLTPVLTGALQGSATTEPAVLEGASITKQIGFNTDYAAAVHENLEAHHNVGQAKYLESSMRENAPKMMPFISSQVSQASSEGGD